jgi:hypothetical protein
MAPFALEPLPEPLTPGLLPCEPPVREPGPLPIVLVLGLPGDELGIELLLEPGELPAGVVARSPPGCARDVPEGERIEGEPASARRIRRERVEAPGFALLDAALASVGPGFAWLCAELASAGPGWVFAAALFPTAGLPSIVLLGAGGTRFECLLSCCVLARLERFGPVVLRLGASSAAP